MSVVFYRILRPLHLEQQAWHWKCLSFSVVQNTRDKSRAIDGRSVSSKGPSRVWDSDWKSCWEEWKRIAVPHCWRVIDLHALILQKPNWKKSASGQTWNELPVSFVHSQGHLHFFFVGQKKKLLSGSKRLDSDLFQVVLCQRSKRLDVNLVTVKQVRILGQAVLGKQAGQVVMTFLAMVGWGWITITGNRHLRHTYEFSFCIFCS